MPVEVKICGLTRPEDAHLAVGGGASRLGVVFAWGPRVVTTDQAREIVAAAADVPVIGVFGAQLADEIVAICASAGLLGAQLHRASTLAESLTLRAAGLEVWRVLPLVEAFSPGSGLADATSGADVVLLEPHRTNDRGQRGKPLDLALAQQAVSLLPNHRVALAGGLTPETVAHAIRFVRPHLVDVSSGVELSPGIKDPLRLKNFLEQVRDASAAA